jgi:hypothetical protein
MTKAIAGIQDHIGLGLDGVEDPALLAAIREAYQSPIGQEAFSRAEAFFRQLTSRAWSPERLRKFLSGWGATHGTASFVSGLMIRIQREAVAARRGGRPDNARLLHEAAAEIGEIISEDTGVDGVPHIELFVQLANSLIGDDSWRLDQNGMPECNRFRKYVRHARLKGPLEDAILTTMASECWNVGEYSYFDSLLLPWLTDVLALPRSYAEDAASYVRIHTGQTELGHFLHSVRAWNLYCAAMRPDRDYQKVSQNFQHYLTGIVASFEELANGLDDSGDEPITLRPVSGDKADLPLRC